MPTKTCAKNSFLSVFRKSIPFLSFGTGRRNCRGKSAETDELLLEFPRKETLAGLASVRKEADSK